MSKTYKRRMKVAPTSWIGILKVIHDFPSNKCELIIITQYTNEGRLKHIHVIPLLIWFYTSTKKCRYTFKSIGPINFSFSHACTSNPFGGHTFAIFNLDSSIAPNIILFRVLTYHVIQEKKRIIGYMNMICLKVILVPWKDV